MEDANMRETKDYIKTDPNPVIISHDHKTWQHYKVHCWGGL
jgi:hypothetical protein